MSKRIRKHYLAANSTNTEIVPSRIGAEIVPHAYEHLPSAGKSKLRFLVRRWRPVVLLSVLAGLVLGCLITALQPPTYQARASLEIQSPNDNFLNMKQILPIDETAVPGTFSDLQTQIKIIQSDSVLGPVKAQILSDAPAALSARPSYSWTRYPVAFLVERAWQLANHDRSRPSDHFIQSEVARLVDSLKVRAIGQTRIIELTAESRDPRLATDFLARICAQYIFKNMDARWEISQRTSESLARLLEDARGRLQQSETALTNYASASGLMFTSDRQSVAKQKLSELQQEFSQAQATRIAAQSRYEIATRSFANQELPDSVAESPIRDYKTKLTELLRDRADLAATYTSNYAKIERLDAQISYLQTAIKNEEQHELQRIKNEYNAAMRRESLLSAGYQAQSQIVSDADKREIQYNILHRDVEGNQQLYDEMLKQVKQAAISSAVRSSNVRILDAASTPELPHSPSLLVNSAGAVLICIAFGMCIGFVRERADSSIKEPGEGHYYLGLPELGALLHDRGGHGLLRLPEQKRLRAAVAPMSGNVGPAQTLRNLALRLGSPLVQTDSANRGFTPLTLYESARPEQTDRLDFLWPRLREQRFPHISIRGSNSLATIESCRAVVASLLLPSRNGKLPRSVVVTSPGPREGKSTVVANVGLTLASTGRRVLLVDGDLRRPRLHAFFGLENEKGLSVLLQAPRCSDQDPLAMVQTTAVPSLSVLTTGPTLQPGANFLQSPDVPDLIERLEQNFDVVLIDTPPVLQVADARILGRIANGVVLVARAGQTAREAVAAAYDRLTADNARLLGMVLNDWNPRSSSYPYLADYNREYPDRSR